MNKKQGLSLILAPFSMGGPNSAAKEGPEVLLKNELDKDLKELGFNVKIIKPPSSLLKLKDSSLQNRIKNIDAILKINSWLSNTVSSEIKNGYLPFTIGGDHSLAIGTISGCTSVKENIGVIWIDRHFDAHSPKNTPSWRAHGMPVAVATADKNYDRHSDFIKFLEIGNSKKLPKVKPENFVQIGIGEKSHIKPSTKWFSMEDIDSVGINKIINSAISYLLKKVKHIYVAWDIDSMNITGTGTSGDGQLTLREGLIIARAINKIRLSGNLIGIEIMEVAPSLEKPHLRGQTVDWAIQLMTTCFGGNLFNNLSRLKRNIHV